MRIEPRVRRHGTEAWGIDGARCVGASRRPALAIAAASAIAVASIAAAAQDAEAPPKPSAAEAQDRGTLGGSFIRRVEHDDGRVALEVSSRTYAGPDGAPRVTLASAVHLGTRAYYEAMQQLLAEHDAVLYESIVPRGGIKWTRQVEQDPARATRESMLFLRRTMLAVRDRATDPESAAPRDGAPAETPSASAAPSTPSIERTIEAAPAIDSRLGAWVRSASVDAWGGAIELERLPDGSFLLISRGADRAPGGEGADADIRLRTPAERRAPRGDGADGIQAALAKAMGLEFQLEAIDYADARWEVADMSEGELLDAFAQRGVEGATMMDSMAGGGLTAAAARGLLMLLRVADGVSGGTVREAARLFLIEALSMVNEGVMREGLGAGLMEVILVDRNAVAINALAARRERGDGVRSIAIFYGAAHMPDLERRLLEEGFTASTERWFEAMSADPDRAGLDALQLESLRRMLESMRDQGAAAKDAGADGDA